MTEEELDRFLGFLTENGWKIHRRAPPLSLSDEIRRRYPRLPADYEHFLSRVSCVACPGEQAWFWCESDYNLQGETETWEWDAYERMSVEWALNDEKTLKYVRRFWDHHFPIAFSGKGDFAYLAVSVSPEDFGNVVYGFAPYIDEDDEVTKVADSFDDLASLMVWAIERGIQED